MTDFALATAHISQLYSRYADSVWRKDPVAFGDCLTEDVEWRIAGKILKGREAAVDLIEGVFTTLRWCSISFKTPIIEVGDGTATGRTFFNEQSVFTHGRTMVAMGTYYHRYKLCNDGRWRYAWRVFHCHYSGPPDLTGALLDTPDYGPPPAMPPPNATTKPTNSGVLEGD